MASATSRRRPPLLALVPAAAVACLLAGCQGSTSTAATVPAGPPSGTVVPPAAPPIKVTVAPASVAPGVVAPLGGRAASLPTLPAPHYVARCPGYPQPEQIALQVSPRAGSAQVRWVSDGNATVRSYRVTAISQRLVAGAQPAAPSITAPPGVGCGPRSVSFSGLRRGTGYVFWLEEGIPDPAGGVRFWMVGQSAGVLVP